jgi:hypothetical protein
MPQFMHDVPDAAPSKATSPTDDESTPTHTSGRGAPWSASNSTTSENPYRIALKSLDGNFRANTYGIVKALLGNGLVKDRLPVVRIAGGYSTVWALYVVCFMAVTSSTFLLLSIIVTGRRHAHGLAGKPRLRTEVHVPD